MKTLNKRTYIEEQSLESYGCRCACNCTCIGTINVMARTRQGNYNWTFGMGQPITMRNLNGHC